MRSVVGRYVPHPEGRHTDGSCALCRNVEHPVDRQLRERYGPKCPVHLVPEPCPTCSAYIAAGL